MYTGQFGCGKTYSLILYRMLSDLIFKYKFLYTNNTDDIRDPNIDYKLPKVVYWSINAAKQNSR